MKKIFFVTGIGTDVGKTIVSAILCEALAADYFKPIQSGTGEDGISGDELIVKNLISNNRSKIHPCAYQLTQAMSPHAAAACDGITIDKDCIRLPQTTNTLVIEGAGGLLVPINNKHTIMDLIEPNYHVVLVSHHYLGSINHTLLSLKLLQQCGMQTSLVFNGNRNKATEDIIIAMSQTRVIGRINQEFSINKATIKKYADEFSQTLKQL